MEYFAVWDNKFNLSFSTQTALFEMVLVILSANSLSNTQAMAIFKGLNLLSFQKNYLLESFWMLIVNIVENNIPRNLEHLSLLL